MKVSVFLLALLVLTLAVADSGSTQENKPMPDQGSCHYCGMDRQKFAHSAMMIHYEDEMSTPTCSIHCTAIDLAAQIGKAPKSIKVNDFNSKKQINAEAACWVIGGDVAGVMSRRAKWAFQSETDCNTFAKEHGGQVASFDEAMNAAYQDMHMDTKMIRDKRKAMKDRRLNETKQ